MRSAFFSLLILSCAVMACGQVNPHTQIRWPGSCTTAGTVYNVQSNTCVALSSISGQVTPNTQVNWPGSCTAAGTVYNVQSNTCVALSSISGQVTPNTQVNWPGSCTAAGTVYSLQSNTCVALSSISGQVTPSTQINWPANCNAAGMVYSSQANACVSTGAAGNPGGTSGQGQMNLGGVFAPIPGLAVDGINGWNIAGGTRYAKGWQTGGGNNGIANAASGATNQTVVADPSYGTTERNFDYTYFPATPFHYQDQRLGATIDYFHNPFGNNAGGGFNYLFNWKLYTLGISFAGKTDLCLYDTFPQSGFASVGCNITGMQGNFVGSSVGNPVGVVAGGGWTTTVARIIQNQVRSAGITESLAIWQTKYGVGDNYGLYSYVYGRNGTTAASDEGTGGIATLVQTQAPLSATCATGCTTGSTSIKISGGSGVQGQGQYVEDTTASTGVVSGHIVSVANGLATGSQALTLDTTVTPSTAWGTINNTDLNAILPILTAPYGTSKTFTVTLVSGTFNTTAPICFSSTFHEQTIPTAVGTASGTQTVTAIIRKPHVGGYVFQGGECGKGLEDTSMTQGGSPHLFDVVGSTSANTIQVIKFQLGAASSPGFATAQTISMTNATASSGTTVAGVVSSWTLFHPWNYAGTSFLLSGSSDSALNTTCTNVQWSTQTQFTCTIAGLSGTHTTTTAMTAILTPALLSLRPMAETLDVQNEALTPPQVDGTLVLEANTIPFAASDTVLQTNSVTSRFQGLKASATSDNPYGYIGGGNFSVAGHGAQGGGSGTTTNAVLNLGASATATDYAGWGGVLTPPNIANISGYYAYGLNFGVGPSPEGVLLNVGVDATQRTNPTYNYSIIQALTNSSAFALNLTPATGALLMQAPGNLTFSSVGGTNLASSPVASNSALQITGGLFTGGTGTTTYPYFYINPNGSSAPTDWNTNGTWLGIQTHGASTADFANWKNNSVTKFLVDSTGAVTTSGLATAPTFKAANTTGTMVTMGTHTPTGSTTPASVDMGATYGTNTPGSTANAKLQIYNDGTNVYGIGLSASLFEIRAGTGASFGYFADTTKIAGMSTTGINLPTGETYQINGAQIAASNLSNGTTGTGQVVLASALPTKYTPSLTPSAVTASTCGEQTFTVTGLATGQGVLASNPPSALSHVWIGSKRVSATNTLAVEFCADSTGGTPPTGTWIVVAF